MLKINNKLVAKFLKNDKVFLNFQQMTQKSMIKFR